MDNIPKHFILLLIVFNIIFINDSFIVYFHHKQHFNEREDSNTFVYECLYSDELWKELISLSTNIHPNYQQKQFKTKV